MASGYKIWIRGPTLDLDMKDIERTTFKKLKFDLRTKETFLQNLVQDCVLSLILWVWAIIGKLHWMNGLDPHTYVPWKIMNSDMLRENCALSANTLGSG